MTNRLPPLLFATDWCQSTILLSPLLPEILRNDMNQADRWAPLGGCYVHYSRTPHSLSRTPEIAAASAMMEGFEEQSRQEVWGVRKHRVAVAQGGCWYSDEQRKSGDVKRVTTSNRSFHFMNLVGDTGWHSDEPVLETHYTLWVQNPINGRGFNLIFWQRGKTWEQ